MMYVMSLAADPETNSLYTFTVPNSKVRRLVVSRFDQSDTTLSEEYMPRLAPDSGLKFTAKNRSLDELYITGAVIADGRMYAISAAYSTLLAIDLGSRWVVAAHAIRGLVRPVGIAVRGGDFYIVGEGGEVFVIARP
jgi:disulfide bond formation protein DsbB